ncbi:MAG: hypothetical protein E7262_06275 [Lachnospiraceae bacterium]|nr:hypothetical protein [Lachnospiraceae bacterium]
MNITSNLNMNILPIIATKNKALLIPFFIMVIILLCSPAIQLKLSTHKNKYVGLIFPAIVCIFFIVVAIIAKPNIILSLIMIIGAPAALVVFHVIIRKNLRY